VKRSLLHFARLSARPSPQKASSWRAFKLLAIAKSFDAGPKPHAWAPTMSLSPRGISISSVTKGFSLAISRITVTEGEFEILVELRLETPCLEGSCTFRR